MTPQPWSTIPALIDHVAAAFPHNEALVQDDVRLTFTQLRERVHVATRALMARGIGPGDMVSVWAPNVWEWVVAGLAIHCSGATLVPVNTRFKGREAEHILRTSRARLLFTMDEFLGVDYLTMLAKVGPIETLEEIVVLRGAAPEGTTSFERFLDRAGEVDETARAARGAAVADDDTCHVLFTSGTTGTPKGAMLSHGAVCRAYNEFCDAVDLQPGDRYLVVLPFFHSFGLNAGILCCLMRGATIIPRTAFDVDEALTLIRTERITHMPGAPTVFFAILDRPDLAQLGLSSLRVVIIGAAAIPIELVRELRAQLGVAVVTGFGITESSGIVTMARFDDDPEIVATTAGRPLPGISVRVVDDDGIDVARGITGEVLVGGYSIMKGYLSNPEQTATTVDADGWLHTGDIGMLRDDDALVITDRKKDMFVVGGFNAYPAEIENVMTSHPAISQVAVIGVPDERMGEVGMAFVIKRTGDTTTTDEIVAWCRENMANYKVPRSIELVDALPLNASGKVLKYELRDRVAKSIGYST